MTTDTTDAEAIARDLNAATSLVIEQMHEAGIPICMREGETTWRTYHAGFDLSLFAQRITDACCDAILSYLAARREAQEPVGYTSGGELERLREWFRHADAIGVVGEKTTTRCIPLYTAPPPTSVGEVERLRAAIKRQVENIDRWRETGEPASPEESKSIYEQLVAALNGGREKGK